MTRRHPCLWLMTDERIGDALFPAIAALPRGAGIIFRHYSLPMPERRALFARVRRVARRKALWLVLADSPRVARNWGADGFHGHARGNGQFLHTAPAHSARELWRATRDGADLIFVSPVYPTRSHPEAPTLGPVGFGTIARQSPRPVIALGGMDSRRARVTNRLGGYGWAAIDGLTPRKIRT
ncbi:thiamine phosphate synthase [Sphingomonas sp. LaA6.9]|uniref:thiamine phosphate synthase n=1 Tax=Sphingomonas sp. LaA6.9 TaxID=2919914 RepID=UPI001F4F28F7|nr:thiamine phosphate synthase [Sphingomonas sp. LaA6.9]MCJ8159607.1 thiamine phosphate synthase [Sphingomonas sp. LaA6.9]